MFDTNLISRTKKDTRYHTPIVKQKLQEREQFKESVIAAANDAFASFQAEISSDYAVLRTAVNQLGEADCLFSLAQVATQAEKKCEVWGKAETCYFVAKYKSIYLRAATLMRQAE